MANIKDRFPKQVRSALRARGLTQTRVAIDLGENPVMINQMLCGRRPYRRLREKLARYLGIDANGRSA